MIRRTFSLNGPGNAVCKPLSVPTHDGPNRFIRFKLRAIRKDFWNVLCHANAEKLKSTAEEVIRRYSSSKNREIPLLTTHFINTHFKKLELNKENNDQTYSNNIDTDQTTTNSSETDIKSKGFWIVFSKRFKASLRILNTSDIITVLKAFHIANRDSGEYVVAVLELRRRIEEFRKNDLLDTLLIFSRRLKLNTQKDFFTKLANHVPNVLYSLNGFEIVRVLWNLSDAGYNNMDICRNVRQKFLDRINELSDDDLGSACLAFGRYGYRNLELYEKIQEKLSRHCNANSLFQVSWGLFLASVDATNLIETRKEIFWGSLGKLPRWKIQVWKNIIDGTNCSKEVIDGLEGHL